MTAPNPSILWGRLIIDELAAQGVETAFVAPGSRSTPLVVAASAHEGIATSSILEERSCAFAAVGHAKRTARPVAIISTSGTAGANFHPAVIEADRSRTPLLVLTADRPTELHHIGANQTIDQRDLFGSAVRWNPTIPEPSPEPARQRALRNRVGRAVHRTRTPRSGPVHLNVPFRKPLAPVDAEGEWSVAEHGERTEWRLEERDVTIAELESARQVDPTTFQRVQDAVEQARRPVIVLGSNPPGAGDRLGTTLEALGIPTFADPLSGARYTESAEDGPIIGGYDGWLASQRLERLDPPDFVLRVGSRPTSKRLREYLEGAGGPDVLIDSELGYRDPSLAAGTVIPGKPGPLLETLAETVSLRKTVPEWRQSVLAIESAYQTFLDGHEDDLPVEGRIARLVIEEARGEAAIVVSNSMPIRDLDRFAPFSDQSLTVIGNRGASGIDGIVSSGLGVAAAHDGPTTILLGDLAFYHDLTGLLLAERLGVEATIVVINNDGGGIFHQLPIADYDPPFTEQFKTPHGLTFEGVSDLYEVTHTPCEIGAFPERYRSAQATAGTSILEIATDAEQIHEQRQRFEELLTTTLA